MKCVFCAIQTRLWYEDKYHYTSSLFIEKQNKNALISYNYLVFFYLLLSPTCNFIIHQKIHIIIEIVGKKNKGDPTSAAAAGVHSLGVILGVRPQTAIADLKSDHASWPSVLLRELAVAAA